MKKYFKNVIFYMSVLCSLASCESTQPVCELSEIKTLFTVVGMQPGVDTGYSHYVLVKEFSKECIDSTTMVNIALAYIDTISIDKPVDMIHFYNSDKDFIPSETSQIWEEVNKSCLAVIIIDKERKLPKKFVFYDGRGEIKYEGNRWVEYQINKK